MTTLSTHVLDTSLGLPAEQVRVSLYQIKDNQITKLAEHRTDNAGRITSFGDPLIAGQYQLVFATADYFAKHKRECFYPTVTIVFVLDGLQDHCHVPLLISSYGFSTYRGS